MKVLFTLLALVAAGPAIAQAIARDTDQILTQAQLTEILAGTELEFHDKSRASYWADGRYAYRYAVGSPPHIGRYDVVGSSEVCVSYPNGDSRCDMIIMSGETYVLITKRNQRFPVKSFGPFDPEPDWYTAATRTDL